MLSRAKNVNLYSACRLFKVTSNALVTLVETPTVKLSAPRAGSLSPSDQQWRKADVSSRQRSTSICETICCSCSQSQDQLFAYCLYVGYNVNFYSLSSREPQRRPPSTQFMLHWGYALVSDP